jgi:hypothetical protein
MSYNAAYFGNLFVEVAQRPSSRVSYHVDKDNPFLINATGYGNIPYDTGRTQRSVYLSRVAPTSCTVRFNGETSPYAVYLQYCLNVGRSHVPNSHRNFLQKFAKNEFIRELQRQFKEVRIQ